MFESLNRSRRTPSPAQVRGARGERRRAARRRSRSCRRSPRRACRATSAPTWSGVIGPAGMPRPIVDKLNAAVNRAIRSQAFRRALPRSATSRPAARRRTSPTPSRGTPRNGRAWWSARAPSSNEVGTSFPASHSYIGNPEGVSHVRTQLSKHRNRRGRRGACGGARRRAARRLFRRRDRGRRPGRARGGARRARRRERHGRPAAWARAS